MSHPLKELTTVADLDAALAASAVRPILIYKHSLTCGTSGVAAEEIDELVAGQALPVDVFVVRIQQSRDVSRAIEERLRVRHESPQVLLVSDGQALWHASHYRVTVQHISSALAQHLPRAQPAST